MQNKKSPLGRGASKNCYRVDIIHRFCMGRDKCHTDSGAEDMPTMDLDEVRAMVDTPIQVPKGKAPFILASSLPTRAWSAQKARGEFIMLWADIDKGNVDLGSLTGVLSGLLSDCDYEIYSSRSATKDDKRWRIILPLTAPISFQDWEQASELLNDAFDMVGIPPDRSSEKAGQPCFLPNRGTYYESLSKREGVLFDPLAMWGTEIAQRIAEAEASWRRKLEEKAKRDEERSKKQVDMSDTPINVFNQEYTVEDVLIDAGYDNKPGTDHWRHPGSESGSYSARVWPDTGRVSTLSTRDPLHNPGGHAHDSFSAFAAIFHDNDTEAAIRDVVVKLQESVGDRDFEVLPELGTTELEELPDAPEFKREPVPLLEYPPGTVGDIAKYIFNTCIKPQQPFAIAAALATVSYLNDNRAYVASWNTALNLYVCLIGPSGYGKESPRHSVKELVKSVRGALHLGGAVQEQITSGAAILTRLSTHPSLFIMSDEFGKYLAAAKGDRGNPNTKETIKDLMSLFGMGRSTFMGKSYAVSKHNIGELNNPYVSVLGTSTPETLMTGIDPEMINDGFLNRVLFVQVDDDVDEREDLDPTISDDLRDKLLALHDDTGRGLVMSPAASALLKRISDEVKVLKQGPLRSMWVRAKEHTIKVSGLLAIGDGWEVTGEHIAWSWAFVRQSIGVFNQSLEEDLHETPFSANVAKVLKIIRDAKKYAGDRAFASYCKQGYMPRGKLLKVMRIKTRELDDIIMHLTASEQVAVKKEGRAVLLHVKG
jgi:hypothetical protein